MNSVAWPRAFKLWASMVAWVVFPHRSTPSNTIRAPLRCNAHKPGPRKHHGHTISRCRQKESDRGQTHCPFLNTRSNHIQRQTQLVSSVEAVCVVPRDVGRTNCEAVRTQPTHSSTAHSRSLRARQSYSLSTSKYIIRTVHRAQTRKVQWGTRVRGRCKVGDPTVAMFP